MTNSEKTDHRPDIIAVVGPTASGKTSLGIEVAERLGTEIVSADSMQVYRGMAIGTGAPTADEQARVRHHFVGFLDPADSFSAGEFERLAKPVVQALNGEGKPAVVVGGSGLYVRALQDGFAAGLDDDPAIRARLQAEARDQGADALYERLKQVDPEYATVIPATDLKRIVRGLEVYEVTGVPFTELHRNQSPEPQFTSIQIALDMPRAVLYDRINRRCEAMIEGGFIDELKALLDAGHGPQIERLKTLGYREFAAHLRGECSYDEALSNMQRNTRRYAKRQLGWFRADDRINWIHAEEKTVEELADDVFELLQPK